MNLRMTGLLTLTVANAALFSTGGSAQQTVPFRGDTPIAPQGIPKIALPDHPVYLLTDEDNGAVLRIEPAS
jgi:hypothetical protein